MDKLSLPEILRFLVIGFVMIGASYICEPVASENLVNKLGSIGTPILAFVLGSLTFFVYRSIIYGFLLKIVDLFHKDNVRSILMRKYNILSRREADFFWKIIQESGSDEGANKVELGSAGTHLLYMTSLITLLALVYLWVLEGFSVKFWGVLPVCLITGLSAFVSDYYVETNLTFLLMSKEDSKLDGLARRLGYFKSQNEKEMSNLENEIGIRQNRESKVLELSEEMQTNKPNDLDA